jgi:phosphoglucosamine mutase
MKKYFGTDGIRGRVGEHPISAEFMLKLGWATGKVFSRYDTASILIGKDTRISGYMFETALEAGLTAAGVHTKMLGPMPTPAVAYLTRTFGASAGIVISASHNSHEDNGIKFFSSQGTKLDDRLELEIEAALEEPFTTVASRYIGKVIRINDASGRYIEFCKSTYRAKEKLHGLKIVLDCANGATYHIAPSVFTELGANVTVIGNKPDGLNINDNCGSTHPTRLIQEVQLSNADLGIAFDGDGDRVLFVDSKGNLIDGDELLYIIAMDRAQKQKVSGIVGTQMSNLGLELALKEKEMEFVRAKVGDRFVMTELISRQWLYGGEGSGHIVCLDMTTTGDGIISALQVLGALRNADKTIEQLCAGMKKFPQVLQNVKLPLDKRWDVNSKIMQQAIKDVEVVLGKRGRILLRSSGTEPLVRVMVEGEDAVMIHKLARQLTEAVTHSFVNI